MNGIGNVIVIGGLRTKQIRVYEFKGTEWVLRSTIVNTTGGPISLSDDGRIVAIGSSGYGRLRGLVNVFKFDETNWVQNGKGIDGEATGDYSGSAVSLSSDGTIVAIGAYRNQGSNGVNSGHVRVFKLDGNDWVQMGTDVDGERPGDYSGKTVSLSSDGTIVAIGSDTNNGIAGDNSGHVRVYEFDETKWEQRGGDIDGKAVGDRFGGDISLSSDGTIIAIGARHGNDDKGYVKIYGFDGTGWVQSGPEIMKDDMKYIGTSLSLSSDGSTVATFGTNVVNNGVMVYDTGLLVTKVPEKLSVSHSVEDPYVYPVAGPCYKLPNREECNVSKLRAPSIVAYVVVSLLLLFLVGVCIHSLSFGSG